MNEKELQLKALKNSGCTHTEINKQLVKNKRIKIKPIDKLFEVFNIDRTKNREVIRFVLLELKINEHKKHINITAIDLNSMDIFLEYDQLIKHNPEVNYIKDQKITANEQSRERTTGNGKKFKKLLKKQK